MLNQFIDSFEYNIVTGENYDESLITIVNFANQAGFALQNVDFNDFAQAMASHKTFRLE
jgi:L-cystine uptake protein TcyP (sodium:dicarboxylate symporter family)